MDRRHSSSLVVVVLPLVLTVALPVVIVFWGCWAPAGAVGKPELASMHWAPTEPIQGTAFVVQIDLGSLDVAAEATGAIKDMRLVEKLTGTAAGESLHFVPDGSGGFWALAAAPLDRGSSLNVNVKVTYADGSTETLEQRVLVSQGNYEMEELTVAPQFVATDRATAERQAREQERAMAVSRAAHETPRLWNQLILPRESRLTSLFGTGREFNGKVQSRHTGVDFAGAVGAPVYAAADGVVALVDAFHLAGNVVYLNHGAGLVTGYFHLSEALVHSGDKVSAGDLIGRVGATGRVTGPHLHWLVRYGSISIDGLSLVDLLATQPESAH